MNTYDQYAQYYDILYQDKNYVKETDFVDTLIKKHQGKQSNSLLDLGCGSGEHAYLFAEKGYNVLGIDRSEPMIDLAASQYPASEKLSFKVRDITNYTPEQPFDTAVALFNVIGYLSTNDNLNATFSNVAKSLNTGGLFIFDFWYGPAILHKQPQTQIKRLETDYTSITRISEPHLFHEENRVNLFIELIVEDRLSNRTQYIHEEHPIRYFFMPEIEYFAKKHGFDLIDSHAWMESDIPPSLENTYACVVLKKN